MLHAAWLSWHIFIKTTKSIEIEKSCGPRRNFVLNLPMEYLCGQAIIYQESNLGIGDIWSVVQQLLADPKQTIGQHICVCHSPDPGNKIKSRNRRTGSAKKDLFFGLWEKRFYLHRYLWSCVYTHTTG